LTDYLFELDWFYCIHLGLVGQGWMDGLAGRMDGWLAGWMDGLREVQEALDVLEVWMDGWISLSKLGLTTELGGMAWHLHCIA
jgi:hypothetical protein